MLTGFPWLLVGTAHVVRSLRVGRRSVVFLVSGVIALFAELLILGLGRPRRGQYRTANGIIGFTDSDVMGVRHRMD